MTQVPAVDGIMRDHKLWRPDGIAERSRSKNGSQNSKRGWCVLMPADYPPPIRRQQIRPGINKLYGARTAADYDHDRRQVTWSNDDGSLRRLRNFGQRDKLKADRSERI